MTDASGLIRRPSPQGDTSVRMYSVTSDGHSRGRFLQTVMQYSIFARLIPLSHPMLSQVAGYHSSFLLFANYFTLYAEICIWSYIPDAVDIIVLESKKDSRLQ